jgi:hypothetical protein
MAYTGKKPVDFVDVTQSQSMTVSDDLTVDTNTLIVDSTNNNVGIGTTSPNVSAKLDVRGSILNGNSGEAETVIGVADAASNYYTVGNRGNLVVQASSSTAGAQAQSGGRLFLRGGDSYNGNQGDVYIYAGRNLTNNAKSQILFEQGLNESMRLNPNGALLINATSAYSTEKLLIDGGSGSSLVTRYSAANGAAVGWRSLYNNSTGNAYHAYFQYNGAGVGSIISTASSTSFNTSSDYRLKEDWQPMTGATERVKSLNPVNFAWKVDGSRVDGFLAHEAAEVVPEAVTGEKDAMMDEEYEVTPAVLDEDGNVVTEAVMGTHSVPEYQGIDQSKLVPLLTAALQEAIAEIETLKTKVAALENA